MVIEYINPLSRAWNRMQQILFSPFDPGKWLTLGFTAFLAHLTDSKGGGGQGGDRHFDRNFDWDAFFDLPRQMSVWIAEHQFWMAVIIAGLILGLILLVVLVWLSSRGSFMFLDNVVHNRSQIEKPWHAFKNSGDALFLWRLAFLVIAVIVFIDFIVTAFLSARGLYYHGGDLSSNIVVLLGLAITGLALSLIVIFISRLLTDFIVPIMYKYDISVGEAWRKFLPLFSQYASKFIVYGFFILGLYILVVMCVLIGGVLTLGIGLILLVIPYVGSVLLLPVSVTFRALSLEFLAQFGEEYTLFPAAGDAASRGNG